MHAPPRSDAAADTARIELVSKVRAILTVTSPPWPDGSGAERRRVDAGTAENVASAATFLYGAKLDLAWTAHRPSRRVTMYRESNLASTEPSVR
jgi:hypothetical protein